MNPPSPQLGANRPAIAPTGDLGVVDLSTWPKVSTKEMVDRIKIAMDHVKLPAAERLSVEEGVRKALASPNPSFYLQRLFTIITTPEDPAQKTQLMQKASAQLKADVAAANAQAKVANTSVEENDAKSASRSWTTVKGYGGKTYDVDKRDPKNVFVKIRVHATGPQAADIKKLEDAIEKTLGKAGGFTVDIEFVERDGDDVFTVGTDPTVWPNCLNWSAGTFVAAHECLHLMNVEDAYNVPGRHAANGAMPRDQRLSLFLHSFDHGYDKGRDRDSIMGHGDKPTAADVCTAVGGDASCVQQRLPAVKMGSVGLRKQ